MSLLLIDLTYLGIKTISSVSKYIGIATYNLLALAGGYQTIYFFPKSENQLLIEEIRGLKKEISSLRGLVTYQHPELDYIAVEEMVNQDSVAEIQDSVAEIQDSVAEIQYK